MNLNSKGNKSKFQVTETGKLNAQIINMGVGFSNLALAMGIGL